MKLLHIGAGNMFGGIETVLVTLARHRSAAPELHQDFAVCFEGRLSKELKSAGATPTVLGPARASRPWTLLEARRRLRRLMELACFDAVACHGSWAHAIFGAEVLRSSARLVAWLHGAFSGKHWLERWAAKVPPTLAIANSRFSARESTGLPSRTRVYVLYSPVEPPAAHHSETRVMTRRSFGIQDTTTVILSATRMEELKGVHMLLEALGHMSDSIDWAAWIAGGAQRRIESRYVADLTALAHRLGIESRIRFLGQRTDVPHLMAAADVYCQPNVGPDSFGVSFVEALYSRLPVVTTAMGGALEIVDSSCGVLTPPEPDAVANALAKLAIDLPYRSRLGESAPRRARALCDPAQQTRALAGILAESLSTRAR